MRWAEWVYFENNWQDDPRIKELREKRAAGRITRLEYKSGIQLVKQAVLEKMWRDGRITEEDLIAPGPPPPTKTRKPNIGKRVSIGKAVPAHGRAHNAKTAWKYASEFPGGLPGLGKK